ncbi:class I SAM-dependent methyltransferase [Methylocapsa acidiphila]|uniref:class I SAM-dependent methyltransferase n=1 Tax=Methylocapsa acidiphila TaxID=133552 RepID=UPI0003FE4285|nr:class I SAM-dependent methyltransferase [Methylocapsa acidiphila]
MPLDVVDLRTFYASPLGELARRRIGRIVRQRFSNCAGYSVLGVGYATPYLGVFRDEAVRVLAFMPAEQGVVHWPSSGESASSLVETTMMPLPDSSIDRAILVHSLEITERPHDLLAEIWRVLTPGGRILVVAPSRGGLWARIDATPFGHGQPYSLGQLRHMMRETLFSPTHWTEALYTPPFKRRSALHAAAMLEQVGAYLSLPGAGVLIVEATKQLYRPVGVRSTAERALSGFEPALAPEGLCA